MTVAQPAEAIDILLIEDNAADVRLTQEALREARMLNRMSVAHDGMQALAMLRKEGAYTEMPRPDLIFLDLNLPKRSGIEVLSQIKGDPNLKSIPVVVITSSKAESDILKSYDLHANCYVTKPLDLDQFIAAIRAIEGFWLTVVKLPSKLG